MYPDWALQVLGLAGVVWFAVLTFVVLRQGQFLKLLFPKSESRDIRRKFEEVIGITSEFDKRIADINKRLGFLEEDGLKHIQKVNLVRYNPYQDTGGDQSFSVAFLDKENSGFVITSLHTRSGTRVFAKPVMKGKSGKYKFSKEEQEAVSVVL